MLQDFDNQIVISVFAFNGLLQIGEILVMAQPLENFIGQVIALLFNQVRQGDHAAAADFQDHVAEGLILGDGKAHGLHFISAAVRMELDPEIHVVSGADDDGSRRRVDDARFFLSLRNIDVHLDIQHGIVNEFVVLEYIQHVVQLVDALLVDIVDRVVHVVTADVLIPAVRRPDRIGQGRRTAAAAVDGFVDRIVYRRGRQDRRQLVVFNDLDPLYVIRARIGVTDIDSHGDARRQPSVQAGNACSPVLVDAADFRAYGP